MKFKADLFKIQFWSTNSLPIMVRVLYKIEPNDSLCSESPMSDGKFLRLKKSPLNAFMESKCPLFELFEMVPISMRSVSCQPSSYNFMFDEEEKSKQFLL